MPRAAKKLNRKQGWSQRLKNLARDHFIPHGGNNHVPHVLHHRALFGYSIILIALKVLVVSVGIAFPAFSLFSSSITPANIITLTNETRRNLDLAELSIDNKLMQAAQAKAEDMFANGYFAHTSPTGVTPWYWFKTYGYEYRSAGENLAAHFTEAEDVEAGWMASPTHRDNIVSNRYNEIGVGVAQGEFEGYQTTFVVQMFGYELHQEPVADSTPTTAAPATVAVAEPEPEPVATEPEPEPVVAVAEPVTAVASVPVVATTPSTAEITAPTMAAQPQANEPVTTTPVDSDALVIDIDSLVLTPIESGYSAQINMDNASEAVLYMGSNRVAFVPSDENGVWQSVILYNADTISSTGERLYMVAGDADGRQQIVDLAWIMPGTTAPEVYAFKGAETPKLLGVMDVANLDDNVHKFYLFTLLFLGGALLIAVFVKIDVQRPTMIAHSLAVIALALLLSVL